MSTKGGQSISHDIQKLPGVSGDGAASPAGARAAALLSGGGYDLGAGRLTCGISADEHGVAVVVGVEEAEVAAQGEEHGRDAALVEEVAFHGGPSALGEPIAVKLAQGPTVGELAERYLDEHVAVRCKPKTESLYRLVVAKHILPELGKRPALAVGHKEVSRTRFPWTQNWLNRSVQGGPEHGR